MKYIKKYESFKSVYSVDILLDSYFNDKITGVEFYEKLEMSIERLDEDLVNWIQDTWKNTKDKTEDFILTLAVKSYIKICQVLDKFKQFAKKIIKVFLWILNKISEFQSKHPVLFKIIVISLLIIIITLLSTQRAFAQGEKVNIKDYGLDTENLNTLIGWVDKRGSMIDPQNAVKHEAMLIDLKDGVINGTWTKMEVQKVLNFWDEDLRTTMQNQLSKGVDRNILSSILDDFQNSGKHLIDFSQKTIKSLDGSYFSEKISIISDIKK